MVVQGAAGAMKVAHGEGGARGLLARGIQAARPDAAKAVTVGEEIEQLFR